MENEVRADSRVVSLGVGQVASVVPAVVRSPGCEPPEPHLAHSTPEVHCHGAERPHILLPSHLWAGSCGRHFAA